MQLLSGLIIVGSYLFTSLKSVSQILEDSKVPYGRILEFRPRRARLLHVFVANGWICISPFGECLLRRRHFFGDADTAFEFNEFGWFEIKTHLYRPLLYTPIVGALATFSGLANIGFPPNLIQVVGG